MSKHFYLHLITFDDINKELDSLEISSDEKNHLVIIAQSTIHHAVVDIILGHLSDKDKKSFLMHLHADNHDDIWLLLKDKVEGVEDKITNVASSIKKELIQDIKKLRS